MRILWVLWIVRWCDSFKNNFIYLFLAVWGPHLLYGLLSTKCESLSPAWLSATPWTAAHQAPLSMRFSRQGCWSGVPFPSPGDLPHPGIKARFPALQADSLPTELQGSRCSENGYPPDVGCGLLLLRSTGSRKCAASVPVARGLHSFGSSALEHRLNSCDIWA